MERASFQLYQERLCMPFSEFHRSMEVALGRPVYTHEFADQQRLIDELRGKREKPTMDQILDLIPEEKRIVVVLGGGQLNWDSKEFDRILTCVFALAIIGSVALIALLSWLTWFALNLDWAALLEVLSR